MRVAIMGGTSGIGLATAEQLSAGGAEVIVTGRDQSRLDAAADRVAKAVRVDGTDPSAVTGFCAEIGEVDHLVLAFSPGAAAFGPIASKSLDDIRQAFEGKLFGYLLAVQQARVRGSITFVSAASARAAVAGTTVLAAVNGAIERMVSPLAAELAPVRVNAVLPGVIDTPWWSFVPADQRREQFAALAAEVPAGRVGTAHDVADAITYLIGATFVTGSVLSVDGGFTVA